MLAGRRWRQGGLQAALADVQQIDIDLSDVTFMDSTGLALLVDWHRRLDGAFRLAAPRPAVHKLFRLTDLTGVMSIHDSVGQATSAQEA